MIPSCSVLRPPPVIVCVLVNPASAANGANDNAASAKTLAVDFKLEISNFLIAPPCYILFILPISVVLMLFKIFDTMSYA